MSRSNLNGSQCRSQMVDLGNSNVECQNDLNVKLFDVGHSNVKCHNDMNVKHQNVPCSTFE